MYLSLFMLSYSLVRAPYPAHIKSFQATSASARHLNSAMGGMKKSKRITIGIRRGASPLGVAYCQKWCELSPCITVWQDAPVGPNSSGASVDPSTALNRYSRFFRDTNSEWFIPMLEAMASGQFFTDEEIIRAFEQNNEGISPEVDEITWRSPEKIKRPIQSVQTRPTSRPV